MTTGSWPVVPQPNPLIANRYRKGRSLGAGGFGEVFYAEDIKFNPPRPVAIKIVHTDLLVDPQVRDGISKEANVLAQFKHPNILRVLDFEVGQAGAFIVTELAEGGSLAQKLKPDPNQPPKPLPRKEVLFILERIALALDEAHSHNIVHRDIKPANILLDINGQPQLADFGFALTVTKSIALQTLTSVYGTPQYVAPEVWNDQAGKSSDIYALGVMLYEMITGYTPFLGNFDELKDKHLNGAIPTLKERYPRLRYPQALDAVIFRALAKKATQRYKKAIDLFQAFKAALEEPDPPVRAAVTQKVRASSAKTPAQPANPLQTQNIGPKQRQPARGTQIKLLLEKINDFEAAKSWAKVIEAGEQILALDKNHKIAIDKLGRAYFNNGLDQYRKKKWLEASKSFKEALNYDDSQAQTYKLLGICLFNLNDPGLTLYNLTRAIEKDPSDSESYYYRGKYLYNAWLKRHVKKELNEAIADFNAALQLAPGNFTLKAEIYFWLGRCYYNRNNAADLNKARNFFDLAISLAPNVATYYSWRGLTGSDVSALVDYSRAIEIEPNNHTFYVQRGNRFSAMGEFDRAIEDYTRVISLYDHSDSYLARGQAYQNSNKHALAINDFNRAIILDARDWRSFFSRGMSNFELGFYKLAINDFNQAGQLESNLPVNYFKVIGLSHLMNKDFKNALFNLEKACQLNPRDGELFYWRGKIQKELKNKDLARQDFDKAISLGYREATKEKRYLGWF
ncbi:MAG: protein kinase [Chloroflexi bacterium]|nr:protein kinase [Chloroflexota bacterium]OJW05524.1 MAG: hypothetical protein BGO39_08865 [Chloroflexi bacterium 54-19]